MTKIKLFHVCCFCKAVALRVEKSMQSHVGFTVMLNLLCPLADLYFVNLTTCDFGLLLFL